MQVECSSSSSREHRLAELGLALPAPASPRARYVQFRRVGSVIYISGPGPAFSETAPSHDKVGADLSTVEVANAARRTMLSVLAVLKAACDENLSRVKQCVKLTSYVELRTEALSNSPP